ncbi:MAG: L,D-transpeptidase family protein [Candidatus Dormibacteraeota bacterium]|nr:L,D-transpeptidase family protein [Candidatus Dormibacteraeota bacterium]
MPGRALALAGAICMASVVAACGATGGTGDIVGAAAKQAQEGPAQVTVSPSNQAQGIALNSPVQVSVKNGHLESVTLTDDVGGDPGSGNMSPTQDSWTYNQGLDSHATYTVDITAVGSNGKTTTTTTSFNTLLADKKLVTTVTPGDGETVGVGDTINLKFNASISDDRKAALLQRVTVQSTPGVIGAWHWLDDGEVHFRTQNYWQTGTKVTVSADLNGFDAGNGVWGLGNWNESFTIGDKHLTTIDDHTHQMLVYQNDQLIDTWPVSMGKTGYETLQGTLLVLYKSYDVKMQSCVTFGGAACIPGSANYYNEDVFWDTAISTTGFFIHAAPWDIGDQGVDDVSHGCVNLSTDRATTFYNWSMPGDVVVISNTGNEATYASGEGDWQIPFAQYANTNGVGPINTTAGAAKPGAT